MASALELYCTGSLNLFNHRTNVQVNSRLLCFDIKALGKMLKKIGLLILTDQIWGRVTENRDRRLGHLGIPGRVSCTAGRAPDGGIQRRDFPPFPQVGGHPQRYHPKRENPVGEQRN